MSTRNNYTDIYVQPFLPRDPIPPHPSPSSTLIRQDNNKGRNNRRKPRNRKQSRKSSRRNDESESSLILSRGSATGDSNPPGYPPPYDQSRYATSTFLIERNSPETVLSYGTQHPAPCPSPVTDKDQ